MSNENPQLPDIVDDMDDAPPPPPEQGNDGLAMEPGPDPEPDWVPPTQHEWESMQSQVNQLTEIAQNYYRHLEQQAHGGNQQPAQHHESDPFEDDPDLKQLDGSARNMSKKQVMAAIKADRDGVLKALGINPDDLRQTREMARHSAFQAEMSSAREEFGRAAVDEHHAEVMNLMNKRPLSYREAHIIVSENKARSWARDQVKHRMGKLNKPRQDMNGAGRPTPTPAPAKAEPIPAHLQGDPVALIRYFQERGESPFTTTTE